MFIYCPINLSRTRVLIFKGAHSVDETTHSEAVEVKILNVLSWLQPLFSLLVQSMLFLSYFSALLWASSAFLSCNIQVGLNSRIELNLVRTLALLRQSYPASCPPHTARKLRQSLRKWLTDYFWPLQHSETWFYDSPHKQIHQEWVYMDQLLYIFIYTHTHANLMLLGNPVHSKLNEDPKRTQNIAAPHKQSNTLRVFTC